MGLVFDFLQGVVKSIPILISKIVTVILAIFTVGLFIGYGLSWLGVPVFYLLVPVAAMAVMWYKLDEGFLLLVLLLLAIVFFPGFPWL